MKKDVKKGVGILIGIILFVTIIFSLTFLNTVSTVKLSCEDGSFLGFGKESAPKMCVACPTICSAEINVEDNKGNLICEGSSKTDGKTISFGCLDLNKHKGEEISINYTIQAENSWSNKVVQLYNG